MLQVVVDLSQAGLDEKELMFDLACRNRIGRRCFSTCIVDVLLVLEECFWLGGL